MAARALSAAARALRLSLASVSELVFEATFVGNSEIGTNSGQSADEPESSGVSTSGQSEQLVAQINAMTANVRNMVPLDLYSETEARGCLN